MLNFLRKVVPWLVAVILLIIALRNVSFEAIRLQFSQANYWFIGVTLLITALNFIVRGWRWQQPLLALGYRPTVLRTTVAIQAGTIAGLIVFGTGELTRCATLQRTDGVPMVQGIGSVVGERILDLLMLIPLLLLATLFEVTRMTAILSGLGIQVKTPGLWVGGLLGVGVLGIILGIVGYKWFLRNAAIQQHAMVKKIVTIIQGLWKGFAAVRQLPNPALFIGLTLLLQLLGWSATYVGLLALDSTRSLPPTAALTIMAISSAGSLIVPTQGGIGTYHFLVGRTLALYGFSATEGTIVATFLHAVGFGIGLLLSSLSFLIVPSLVTVDKQETTKATLESK